MHVFPDRVDPFRLARAGTKLSGSVHAGAFARLGEEHPGDHADVAVQLNFGVGEDRGYVVDGILETTLELTCQRCLESFRFASRMTVAWHLERAVTDQTDSGGGRVRARADDAAGQDGGYEPWYIEGDAASLYTMIEDELLLGIPIMPVHPNARCELAYSNDEVAAVEPSSGRNPFAALKGLLPGSDN